MTALAVADRPTNEERIKAALWFAEHGFEVFSVWSTYSRGMCRCPLGRACKTPGKHPIGTHGLKEATRDPLAITVLLSAASQPNYGLLPPEGVFILDVDGVDGLALLADLEARLGTLPETLRTKTSNGYHIFLRWPADKPRPIGEMFGYVTRWGSGKDVGYVIGPKSVHMSGDVYTRAGVFEIAEMPEAWVEEVLRGRKGKSADPNAFLVIEGGYQLPEPGYTGSRYKAILAYIASRYMRGITQEEMWLGVRDILAPRFAESLPEDELQDRFDRAYKDTPERLGPPTAFEQSADLGSGSAPRQTLPNIPDPMGEAAYHGVAGDIVRAVEEKTEADPAAILGALLAMVGGCMGKAKTIYQGSMQSANLFVIVVGESSNARKGTGTSIAREAVLLAYPEAKNLMVPGLGSGEGLVTRLANEAWDYRAIVTEGEFGRLLTTMNREGSTLSPILRDAWDGIPMGRFLAREQSLVPWHHVSIVANITVTELKQKLTSGDAANGFGNRFIWLTARRQRLMPFTDSTAGLVSPFMGALRRAIEAAQQPGEIHWSPTAASRWEWLYAEIAAQRRFGLWGSLLARTEAQTVRLALLYALLDRSDHIEEEHLLAAEAVWRYAEQSVIRIFGHSTGNADADALLEYLADGPVDWETAKKALGIRRAADLKAIVELLESLDLVEVISRSRDGGRPRREITAKGANPANSAGVPRGAEHE